MFTMCLQNGPVMGMSWGLQTPFSQFSLFSGSVVSNSATPWTAGCQASLSVSKSQSLLKLMSITSVMPSNHLILCRPLLLHPQFSPVFSNVSSSHQVAKVLELQLQHQSFQWIFRTDILYDWLVWSSCSPRDPQESSPTPQFKSIDSSALSLLHSPGSPGGERGLGLLRRR